jgi:REP element-mobilizing transposase RayT
VSKPLWNLEFPPGFRGLDPHKPLDVYWRHLPHWRQDGATYFVTFRLADSLPKNKLDELRSMKREWELMHITMRSHETLEEFVLRKMQEVERLLDQGMGACYLKDLRISSLVEEALLHFDQQRYELGCYVVMPNHIHTIVRPLDANVHPLESLLQSWKGYVSRLANRVLDRCGAFWQDESFDRIIRDEEHLYNAIQYIGRNPRLAHLAQHESKLWIRPSWVELGWRFEA